MKRTRAAGVTLIELMVAVVIVGILAAIGYPSYQNYVKQTRRSDAQIALTQAANQQERFFTECNAYAASLAGTRSCGAGTLGYGTASPESHYILSMTASATIAAACSANTCYTITADPSGVGATGKQSGDGRYRIDSIGNKQWDKLNNGFTSGVAKWTDK